MPDTVPAMLEPGEFVIRKDAAAKIGDRNLQMLNNYDRLENGHTDIDEIIALSTLNGAVNMSHGGNVMKEPQTGYFQDGGKVNDMRNRTGGYSIGVTDSLGMAYKGLEDVTNVLKTAGQGSRYSALNKPQREALDVLDESGVYDIKKALEFLDLISENRARKTGYNTFIPRSSEDRIRLLRKGKIPEMQEGGWGGSTYDILRDAEENVGARVAGDDKEQWEASAVPDMTSFLEAQDADRAAGSQTLKAAQVGADASMAKTGLNVGTVSDSLSKGRADLYGAYADKSIQGVSSALDKARMDATMNLDAMIKGGAQSAETLHRFEEHPDYGRIYKVSNIDIDDPNGNLIAPMFNKGIFDNARRYNMDYIMVNDEMYQFDGSHYTKMQ